MQITSLELLMWLAKVGTKYDTNFESVSIYHHVPDITIYDGSRRVLGGGASLLSVLNVFFFQILTDVMLLEIADPTFIWHLIQNS